MRKITIGGVKRRTGRALLRVGDKLATPPPLIVEGDFPASFGDWAKNRTNRLKALYPGAWKKQFIASAPTSRVAVVLHVYYVDLLPQIVEALAAIPVPFDLLVTNASGEEISIDASALPNVDRVQVFAIENHGRDILPLVSLVNAGLLDPYELVFKVHTKKSAWREAHAELGGSGDQWRESFFTELLGSVENVSRVLDAFASDPSLGILTSNGNVLGPEFWGGDRDIVGALLARLQMELDVDALRFAAGSIYWVRGFLLQGLRALELSAGDFDEEAGQVDATTAHAVERILGIVAGEAGYDLREASSLTGAADAAALSGSGIERFRPDFDAQPRARVIPFYLPQFHTFPENDEWWEKGFTEWSNVAAGTPLYAGHNQPLLPSEFGFYDLTTPGVRDAQYELATSMGIEGFMYYYYWFAGTKLMDMPVEQLAASDEQQPFCIMWANENWTRRWDGSEQNILIAQDYDRVSAKQFIHDVLHLITDPRYIRIDDKPVIAVYRITQIPDHVEVVAHWRQVAEEAGLPGLTVVTVDVGTSMQGVEGELAAHGLDAYLEFAPHNKFWGSLPREHRGLDERFQGNLLSYRAMVDHAEEQLNTSAPVHRYPGVMVNFDNTARRQWQPDMWYGSNPYTFRRWLNSTVSAVAERDRDERVVFVNAWNEWAEGAVLEPSQRWGRTYLLAVRDVLYR